MPPDTRRLMAADLPHSDSEEEEEAEAGEAAAAAAGLASEAALGGGGIRQLSRRLWALLPHMPLQQGRHGRVTHQRLVSFARDPRGGALRRLSTNEARNTRQQAHCGAGGGVRVCIAIICCTMGSCRCGSVSDETRRRRSRAGLAARAPWQAG